MVDKGNDVFIDSELTAKASLELQEEIIKELEIEDPETDVAKAALAKGCCQGRKDCKKNAS